MTARTRALASSAMLLFAYAWCTHVAADDITPEDEYRKLIQVHDQVQPLGAHPFGARIGRFDGSLSFQETDADVRGRGPALQLVRAFMMQGKDGRLGRDQYAFGDWDFNLPRITTLTPNQLQYTGWHVGSFDDSRRCSNFRAPPSVPAPKGDAARADWEPESWWHGYHLIIPGQGDQMLLSRTSENTESPTMSGQSFNVVTRDHWMLRCLDATANGQPGEGFLAVSPDGTKYWFDELVYRWAPTLKRALNNGPVSLWQPGESWTRWLAANADGWVKQALGIVSGSSVAHAVADQDYLDRQQASLLVTRIEDRFGNTLVYSYDGSGYPTAITASDGRKLTIKYVSGAHRVQSVTVVNSHGASRVWSYDYTGASPYDMQLSTVTQPDGSQWHFDLRALTQDAWLRTEDPGRCSTPGVPQFVDSTWSGSITHPSGLKETFYIKPMEHGRSYVPKTCWGSPYPSDPERGYALVPRSWYSFTLTKRTLAGAGLSSESWNYAYSSPHASWLTDSCAEGGSCASTVTTTITDPGGHAVRYTYSNRYDETEGQLKRTDYYSGGTDGAALRTETRTYASAGSGSWPVRYGAALQRRFNEKQVERLAPLNKQVITQSGDTYTWQAEAFNAYAQVTKEKRFNSMAGQQALETQTRYRNDTHLWVLGLPTQVKNLGTGAVVDQYTYATGNDTLASRSHFGQKVMDYAFSSAGELGSFTDALGHTTTLGSYKRGIPQSIKYPDGTSQSLVVDDFGQITSDTDQAGTTTTYSYDAAGRVTRIHVPGLNDKTYQYTFVTGGERGVGANHWRVTVSQGDSAHSTRTTSYYDATLRPLLVDTYASDGGGHVTQVNGYDWRGLITFSSYPVSGQPSLGSVAQGMHTSYDALGRPTQVSQDSEQGTLITKTAYLSGARKQVTDPGGHVTTRSYQVFDTPSYDSVTQVQAPEGVTQTIARNLYGNPTSISQGGITKHLYYDAQQRLCRMSEPETGSSVSHYDAAGNVDWSASGQSITGSGCGDDQVASGDQVKRSYDAMNRVTGINYPDGKASASFSYDARGHVQISEVASSGAQWSYAYTAAGQLKSETLAIDGYRWPFTYSYDGNGGLASSTYPDGKVVNYAPDALGRPTRAGTYATGASYYADGHLEHLSYMGGAEYVAEENRRDLLSNLSYAQGAILVLSEDMSYDLNANLTKVVDLVDGTRDMTASYDGLNRLVQAQAPNMWGTMSYGYDRLNNLTEMKGAGVDGIYHYDASNRLASISSGGATLHSFVHDVRGNTTQKDGTTLVFDQANRLDAVVGTESYAYDATGHRVRKTAVDGTITYYAYTSAGRLEWQYNGDTKQNSDYFFLGKKLVAKITRDVDDPLLNPPSLSFDANPNDGMYTAHWSGDAGASFDLQEQFGNGAWSSVYHGTGTNKAFSGRSGGTYDYRIRECLDHCGEWGSFTAVGVTPALSTVSAPGGAQSGTYTISWSAPVGVDNYDVQEQFAGGGWQTIASQSTATSITRPGSTDGSYAYRVRANNAYGSRGWSASGAVTVLHAPSATSTVSVPSGTSTGHYTASWGGVARASSYTLQQQVNAGSWSTVYTGTGTSKALSGTTNGVTYGYRVRACNAVGCGPWSGVSSIHVAIPPPVPGNVHLVDDYVNQKVESYVLSWSASSGASKYLVEQYDNGARVGNTTSTSFSVVSDKPPVILTHTYAVQSCNAYACSAWVKSGYTDHGAPHGIPTVSVPSSSSSGSYTASWTVATYGSSSTLQEQTNSGSWHTVYSGSSTSKAFSGKGDATYGYRVESCNSEGCSIWSSTHVVTVAKVPAAPTNVHEVRGATPKIEYYLGEWNAVSGATSYQAAKLDGTYIALTAAGATSAYITQAWIPDVVEHIHFKVRACNVVGCSAWVEGY